MLMRTFEVLALGENPLDIAIKTDSWAVKKNLNFGIVKFGILNFGIVHFRMAKCRMVNFRIVNFEIVDLGMGLGS